MGEAKPITSNFEIVDKKEYINCIKIKNGRYSIGKNALDASLYFDGLVKGDLFINLGKDNVDDNSRKGYLTLKNINSILCLFFHKDSKIEHEIEHVKRFFKNLKYHDKKMVDKIAFDNFITLIRPYLDTNFNQYNYTLNPTTWEFEITKIENSPENSIELKEKKKPSEPKTPNEQVKEIKTLSLWVNSLINQFTQKRIIYIVTLIFVGIFIYYIKTEVQENIKFQQKKIEERNIIENAKAKSNSRTILLNSLYVDINKELENDYKKDGKRNLSESLIARIITLSENFKPYRYIDDGEEKLLSPERGSLFLSLFKSNLDSEYFNSIITKSNFTYSDLSNTNLSGLNLAKQLYGIEGNFNKEAQVLVTPTPRVNLSYSNFRNTNFKNVVLYGDFSNSDFRGASFNNVEIIWSKLTQCNFQGNTIEKCLIKNSALNQSNFKETFLGVSSGYIQGFINCDLRGVVFDGSSILGGSEAFLFENCFFHSQGVFFDYNVTPYSKDVYIQGKPFIENEDYLSPLDSYRIFSYKITQNKDTIIHFNSGSKRLNFQKSEDLFFLKKVNTFFNDSLTDELIYIIIRTNDNINRTGKYIKAYFSFYGSNWDISELKSDTLFIRSSLDKLQSQYRDVIYNHRQDKDNLNVGTASFKNCKFIYTQFKNSYMEYVSFNNSKFLNYNEMIGNQFINTTFKGNDFRIKSGNFLFIEKTTYDSLLINKKFPVLKLVKIKDSLKNDYKYKNHLKKQKRSDEEMKKTNLDIQFYYANAYMSEREDLLEWVEENELFIKLDSTNMKTGNYILKNTSIKKVPF